jgi:hypothetical protein
MGQKEDVMPLPSDNTTFLRRSLQLDGAASGLTGALLVLAAPPISRVIGLSAPGIARAVGVGLLIFAVALLWNASRPAPSRGEAMLAVALNAVWVVGSLVLIVDGPLTLLGAGAVAAVAAAVLGFSVLEVIGLRRLR